MFNSQATVPEPWPILREDIPNIPEYLRLRRSSRVDMRIQVPGAPLMQSRISITLPTQTPSSLLGGLDCHPHLLEAVFRKWGYMIFMPLIDSDWAG